MSDDIKLADSFNSSIRIEANINGVKKVETIMFSSKALDNQESNELYDYAAEAVKDTVKACIAENK
jgi:DNA-binding protein YbaB